MADYEKMAANSSDSELRTAIKNAIDPAWKAAAENEAARRAEGNRGGSNPEFQRPPAAEGGAGAGACGLVVPLGPSLPGGFGHWLTGDTRLTGGRKRGYYAQNKWNCDSRWGFSEKSPLQIGGEAFRCCPDEHQGAPGTSKGLKNVKRGDCRIIQVYGKRRKSCVSRSSLSPSWS